MVSHPLGRNQLEVILPGSLDGVVQRSDVFALLNHDQNRGILARAKNGQGSLELCVDAKGLKYRFEAPKTALGDELLENLRRGEINESSFCFVVGEDKWEKKEDGTWKRTISKIDELFDVSPVYNAAYSQTTAYTRGRDTAQEELDKADKGDKPDAAYYESLLID